MAIPLKKRTVSSDSHPVGIAWILAAIAVIREQDALLANARSHHPFDEWDNESVSSGELGPASNESEMAGEVDAGDRCVTRSKSWKYLG